MPDSSNVITEIKISELPAATQANATDQLEANQAGTTRRITLDQVSAAVAASDWVLDEINAANPRAFGAVGDGVADDTAAFQACLNAAAADRFAVDMSGAWTYRVTQIVVPDGVVMAGSASTIAITDTLTGTDIAITIGTDCTIETLVVTSPGPGAGATDIISIGPGTRIGLLSMAASAQRTGGGIITLGQDVRIDYLKSVNFDRPFHAYNVAPPAVSSTTGLHIGYADITSYVRGLKFTNTSYWRLDGYHIRGRSPNASVTPGHNGILVGGGSHWSTGAGIIENSGEHAFRIGGNNEGGEVANNVRVGHLAAIRPGGCAFKINPFFVGGEFCDYVTIEGVTGVDCGETPAGPTANNLECCRISSARHVVFEGPIVANKQDFGNSCSHVLMLSNVQHFSAPLVYAQGAPAGAIVLFTETGDGGPGNIENIYIDNVVGSSLGDAITSGITTFNLGNIFINGVLLLELSPGTETISIAAPAAISGPIDIAGTQLGATAPQFIMPNDPLVTRDFKWNGKHVMGRAVGGTFMSTNEWITSPFTNEVTVTDLGGPYINSTTLSTAALGNYGAGIFGSRLGASRRGWGIWPIQTGTNIQIGVIIGVGDPANTASENLRPGLTVGHRGSLTSPALTETVVAPGAGFAKLVWVPGTTAGTAKLLAYAGTSTTPVTIVDNVGSGV